MKASCGGSPQPEPIDIPEHDKAFADRMEALVNRASARRVGSAVIRAASARRASTAGTP
jgi:hypothetical protein